LTERLHRHFLEVVKLELDALGVHDINNIQGLMLFNIGDAEMTVGELRKHRTMPLEPTGWLPGHNRRQRPAENGSAPVGKRGLYWVFLRGFGDQDSVRRD
jgi:hypothetical protein